MPAGAVTVAPTRGYSSWNLRTQVFQPFFTILQSSREYVPSRPPTLFFAARAGVVRPRQPLCDLNPFDSIFLILRRVGIAPGSSYPASRVEAAAVLGVKSRTEAIHAALREIVALKRFKKLMSKYGGKLEFSGHDG